MDFEDALDWAKHWLQMLLHGSPSESGVNEDSDEDGDRIRFEELLDREFGKTYLAIKQLEPFYGGTLPLSKAPDKPSPQRWFNEILRAVRYEPNELIRNTIVRQRANWLINWIDSELKKSSYESKCDYAERDLPSAENIFKLENDTWTIRFRAGEIKRGIKNCKAARDICYLLRNANEPVDILELPDNRTLEPQTKSVAVAKRDDYRHIKRKISQLSAELNKPSTNEDILDELAMKETEEEIAALKKELNQNFDKYGNPRELSGDYQKIIKATQKRVNKRFIPDKLEPILPNLAVHLIKHLDISATCQYTPEGDIAWDCGSDGI